MAGERKHANEKAYTAPGEFGGDDGFYLAVMTAFVWR